MPSPRTHVSLATSFATSLATGVLLLGSGCFYLTEINERPRPRIQEKTSGPYTVVSPATFSATGSRDDQGLGDLTVEWEAFSCDVDGLNCASISDKVTVESTASDFTITPSGKGTLRVELVLRDRYGAFEKSSVVVPVINQDPVIDLQIAKNFPDPGDLGGFVLGLPVQLAAKATDGDGDELTLTWNYEAPSGGGSNPDNVTFEAVPGAEAAQELIGDVPGVWEVTVRADDGDGGVVTATKQVVFAPDGPPCIDRLSPGARAGDTVFVSGEAKTFAVLTAADALDPWPALANAHPQIGTATFNWFIASDKSGGVYAPLGQSRLPEVVIDPADHAPGDHLSLRVELDDRVGRSVDCPVNEPSCSAAGNACSQRMTWEIEIR